ncbi:ankyrin repeat domain-containing protein [Bdellovibrio svalbardensis]|uniref:Ankyrin repeat domain-containing protein n=1 Tax=Bdellovibrio svalbardensis TaxID=2972972 RepID=A0ABT6DFV0_9BACT|nr:ankyrin repeat domain-containing protein [Bdellovibrio svalbardensis]MDG0815342.1 ankyrin repeat domain-containing protein [Bdellovibrio svalbardensis]
MATWEEYKKTMRNEEDIFEYARQGDLPALVNYLAQGGDANRKNHRGYSLLMLAAYNEREAACRLLLEAGADVNGRDNSGNTILMGVSFKGYPQIASLLINSGADRKLRNCMGMTALLFAKTFRRADVVKILST